MCLFTVTHSVRRLSAVCESCGSASMTASYEQIYTRRKSRCLSIVVNEGEAFGDCGENTLLALAARLFYIYLRNQTSVQ